MKFVVGIVSSAIFVAGSLLQVSAAESMHSAMMMPKCSAGDAMVSVDMKTKMYVPADKSHMMMSGHDTGDTSHNGMMKDDMKTMCKSKADAMGAHMMKAKGHM